mgnify:CR=1 FL=1
MLKHIEDGILRCLILNIACFMYAALESIDFGELIALIDSGVIGKLVEVESADGDIVEITVE